jgi:hypothetical protein
LAKQSKENEMLEDIKGEGRGAVLPVRKNGILSNCIDHRKLNDVKWYRFPRPTIDNILHRLTGAKWL